MEAMAGPQWRQLPLLMTHEELGNLDSVEFGHQVKALPGFFAAGGGNRGWRERATGFSPDGKHVNEIADSIRREGYDERYPIPIRLRNKMGSGVDKVVGIENGNHRAAAVLVTKNPLTPVVYNTSYNDLYREQRRQEDHEVADYSSGRRSPLTYSSYDIRKRVPSEPE